MTLNRSSRDNFVSMLKESMKKSCGAPVACFLFGLISLFADISNAVVDNRNLNEMTAFFYDGLREGGLVVNFVICFSAFIIALINFKFQWSKKESNVVYSLGMKRTDMYNAKILGGLIPMTGAVLVLLVLGILGNLCTQSTLDGRFWLMAAYTVFSWAAVYAVSYLMCSVVFCNTGNPVEAVIFLAIFILLPMVLEGFLHLCAEGYTLGGNESLGNSVKWSWSTPFFLDATDREFGYLMDCVGVINNNYFCVDTDTAALTIYNFSSAITASVYTAMLYVIGLFTIKKHKAETAGTWGRSKGITEAAGAAAGFTAFTIVLSAFVDIDVYGNQNFWTFLVCCLSFLAVTVVFKLVFSVRRKEAVKNSLNRFPAYAAVLGAFTIVFALGLFGYSSYVPEVSEINSVSVFTPVISHDDGFLSGQSFFGLREMDMIDSSADVNYYCFTPVQYYDAAEFEEITKLHRTIITDGKIKDTADDACALPITFEYKLLNGKTVSRTYYESTNDTAKMLLAINDLSETKAYIAQFIGNAENVAHAEATLSEAIGQKVILSGIDVFSAETGENIGYIKSDESYAQVYYTDYLTGSSKLIYGLYDFTRTDYMKSDCIVNESCFLYPKDMTKGYCVGRDAELAKAVQDDLIKQSATEYYLHRPEDEIGVLSFGVSYTTQNEPENSKGSFAEDISWNISSGDIKAVVLTKDMTNTVKYLEEHDLMKYFENTRKVSDIKAVKLATPVELYHGTPSHNIPLFFAGYWDKGSVEYYSKERTYYYNRLFDDISNEITDVERITKLLNGSLLFGYCRNDYRIMEISYNDGSVATAVIPADVYESIMK